MFQFDGSELKRRRQAEGLTQAQLARLVGRSHASITHYEIGHSVPPTTALLRICSALEIDPGCLFSQVEDAEEEAVMT
jgi:transcriptional regulator with XRE-family HTH domain